MKVKVSAARNKDIGKGDLAGLIEGTMEELGTGVGDIIEISRKTYNLCKGDAIFS